MIKALKNANLRKLMQDYGSSCLFFCFFFLAAIGLAVWNGYPFVLHDSLDYFFTPDPRMVAMRSSVPMIFFFLVRKLGPFSYVIVSSLALAYAITSTLRSRLGNYKYLFIPALILSNTLYLSSWMMPDVYAVIAVLLLFDSLENRNTVFKTIMLIFSLAMHNMNLIWSLALLPLVLLLGYGKKKVVYFLCVVWGALMLVLLSNSILCGHKAIFGSAAKASLFARTIHENPGSFESMCLERPQNHYCQDKEEVLSLAKSNAMDLLWGFKGDLIVNPQNEAINEYLLYSWKNYPIDNTRSLLSNFRANIFWDGTFPLYKNTNSLLPMYVGRLRHIYPTELKKLLQSRVVQDREIKFFDGWEKTNSFINFFSLIVCVLFLVFNIKNTKADYKSRMALMALFSILFVAAFIAALNGIDARFQYRYGFFLNLISFIVLTDFLSSFKVKIFSPKESEK